jgi:hypothetical protein
MLERTDASLYLVVALCIRLVRGVFSPRIWGTAQCNMV